jgi:hypothetical protein
LALDKLAHRRLGGPVRLRYGIEFSITAFVFDCAGGSEARERLAPRGLSQLLADEDQI